MIKSFIKKYKSNTYQRDPPPVDSPRFNKYLKKEIQFYRKLSEQSKNKISPLEKNLSYNGPGSLN